MMSWRVLVLSLAGLTAGAVVVAGALALAVAVAALTTVLEVLSHVP